MLFIQNKLLILLIYNTRLVSKNNQYVGLCATIRQKMVLRDNGGG